jgi:hypothetical protein
MMLLGPSRDWLGAKEVVMTAEEALEKHQDRLMAVQGVQGVGIGGAEDSPQIVVMVSHGGTEMRKKLPSSVEGYPVKVEVTGEIRAQGS